jgi:hypothetical protein
MLEHSGTYYDTEKERKFKEDREVAGRVHGRSEAERAPPSVQISEGHAYNILSFAVKDEAKLKATLLCRNRGTTRAKLKEQMECEIRLAL